MNFFLKKYTFLYYILSRNFELKYTPEQQEDTELGSAVEQEVGYSTFPSNFKYFVILWLSASTSGL